MTWPYENDTDTIGKKPAKRSLAGEKRRNLMAVADVALAAFLICFATNNRLSQRNLFDE